MTAGTRRNGTSKFGPFQRAAARFGGSDGQDGRDLVEVFGHDEFVSKDGDLRTLPYHLGDADSRLAGLDGFYAARLLKH